MRVSIFIHIHAGGNGEEGGHNKNDEDTVETTETVMSG